MLPGTTVPVGAAPEVQAATATSRLSRGPSCQHPPHPRGRRLAWASRPRGGTPARVRVSPAVLQMERSREVIFGGTQRVS